MLASARNDIWFHSRAHYHRADRCAATDAAADALAVRCGRHGAESEWNDGHRASGSHPRPWASHTSALGVPPAIERNLELHPDTQVPVRAAHIAQAEPVRALYDPARLDGDDGAAPGRPGVGAIVSVAALREHFFERRHWRAQRLQ